MQLLTLFESFELGAAELSDLLGGRAEPDVRLVLRMARAILKELDQRSGEGAGKRVDGGDDALPEPD